MKKRVWCILIFSICVLLLSGSVAAVSPDEIPYRTYTYWLDNTDKKAVGIKPLYETFKTIDGEKLGIGKFNAPSDIATDKIGNIYILDSGNSRIVVLTADGEYKTVISGLLFGGEELDFTGAKGISLDRNGGLLISDSNNARVIRLNNSYEVISLITLPDSSVIPEDFSFQPIKAVEDSEGYIYVLSYGSYYGALVYSSDNLFCGFYGSNEVNGTILDFVGNVWRKITYTQAKHSASQQKIPYQFVNMVLDDNNFLYTITGRTDAWSVTNGQIRRMNPSGKNVLKTYTGENASSFDFGDISNLRIDKTSQKVETNFVGICIDEMGFIYALDSNFGHIFIYDSKANPLCIFGGNTGKQKGTFEYAQAIGVYNQYLYVADSIRNNITIFNETEYGKMYKQAQSLSLNEKYDEALPLWNEILKQDKNNQLAYRAIAHLKLNEKNYAEAMKYSKIGIDRTTYALAFKQVRTEILTNYMQWIILTLVGLTVLISICIYLKKKKDKPAKKIGEVRFSLCTIAHPFENFDLIKKRQRGSITIGIVFLAALFLTRVIRDLLIGFSFDSIDPSDYNALITLAGTVGIALLYTVSNWLICVLAEGKGKYREIFIVTCYSILPLIVDNILQILLSNILVPDESATIVIINTIAWILTGLMLCIGIMIVQEYDFFRFLGTTILTLIAMALVIFIIFMIGILIQELFGFLQSVYHEIFFR